MFSQTEENYLKALLSLTQEHGEATVNSLSKRLDIKKSTVNSMIKKLAEKGLVIYESYKPIQLTEEGEREASLIVRKHRLTEIFLVEKMGFGWEKVHHIAEQIEHIRSPEFFEKMDELLGYPKFDPHGSPIPDKNGKIIKLDYQKLSDCSAGESVKIVAVSNSSREFLEFLDKRDLTLGTTVEILTIESIDKSMTIRYDKGREETLSHIVCDRLLVSDPD
ncbi:metal-dependent transcriptional regulator [Echinicola jeungdonensis]|uniref:Transcriptional regulator MntR n=1 Tax=Echinicola jeungdonensis TaxID=709343 RepID=A0ABV5JAV0_9BACT|nr:metal-dependent transcriptional regulator [Echinicola jeungdonensis]MDN3670504.1 metal-dependent transcriptional regulator [Echinicola jeungdonensis]